MNEENFLVQFMPSKHCFLQFSNKWFQKLNNPRCSCVRLVHPESKHDLYLSWAPQPSYSLNDCSVGINATFAQALGLQEGQLVTITSEARLLSLRQVFLTPVSSDDYEILEMCRDSVEVLVLNQIRVVYVTQVISIWVSKTMCLKLSVDRLESNLPYGRLEQMTELFIENVSNSKKNKSFPKLNTASDNLNNNVSSSQHNHKNGPSLLWDKLSEYLPSSLVDLLKPNESLDDADVVNDQPDYSQMVCRVHPFPNVNEQTNCCSGAHSEDVHPFNVFVHRRTLQKENCWAQDNFLSTLLDGQQSVVLCRLKAVPKRKSRSPNSKSSDDKSKDSASEVDDAMSVCVRLYLIEDSCSVFFRTRTNVSCVFLSRFVRKLLHLDVGSKVLLTAYHPPLDKVLTEVKLVPATTLVEAEVQTLLQYFEERVADHRGVLVNNYCPLPVGPMSCPVLVLLSPPQLECWPLTYSDLQVCLVTVVEEAEKSLESLRVDDKDSDIPQGTSVFEQLVKEGITTLEYGLRLVEDQNQEMMLDNILITGKQGSGKTRLAEAIYTAVSASPHYVYVSVVDCKSLKGKKPESMGKIVAEQLAECVYYQPAVLVLEDLDCIAGVPTQDMESTQESRYFLRMATVLKELMWTLKVGQSVGVVATAQSRAQVHPQLLSARGRHSFTTCLHIPTLEKKKKSKGVRSGLLGGHEMGAALPIQPFGKRAFSAARTSRW
ncbi:Peroxisome biosynthesis protein pex1 [Homalodisca vitripennis]|nr:Peroxisome biosynthesis protein pex1 [Homalodisca vitripennis]